MEAGALVALVSVVLLTVLGLDGVVSRLEHRYNPAHTLSVSFVEQYAMQGHPRPLESGRLSLRKQGKMRWDYSDPAGKLFISDGKTVFLYTAGDNRVEKIPLKSTEDMRAPLAFLLGHLDMKKEFRDLRVRNGDGGVWLEGSAAGDQVPYARVAMLIAPDGRVRQLKVYERDESEMDFVFTDERLNPALPDKMFRFEIPPGAEVVNSMDFGSQEQ
jgi:outer membrane lipoprotein carrier protein